MWNTRQTIHDPQLAEHFIHSHVRQIPASTLIRFVEDRPGHDTRYAINAEKITSQLGFVPKESFDSGLNKTVGWYLENEQWWRNIQSGDYLSDKN